MEKKPGEPSYTGPFTYITPGQMNTELEKNGSDIRVKIDQEVPYEKKDMDKEERKDTIRASREPGSLQKSKDMGVDKDGKRY